MMYGVLVAPDGAEVSDRVPIGEDYFGKDITFGPTRRNGLVFVAIVTGDGRRVITEGPHTVFDGGDLGPIRFSVSDT